MTVAKKTPAKNTPAKKPVAKKPVAKKAVPAKRAAIQKEIVMPVVETPAPAPKKTRSNSEEGMVLYTIRLSPAVIANIKAAAQQQGITHAAVARNTLIDSHG